MSTKLKFNQWIKQGGSEIQVLSSKYYDVGIHYTNKGERIKIEVCEKYSNNEKVGGRFQQGIRVKKIDGAYKCFIQTTSYGCLSVEEIEEMTKAMRIAIKTVKEIEQLLNS